MSVDSNVSDDDSEASSLEEDVSADEPRRGRETRQAVTSKKQSIARTRPTRQAALTAGAKNRAVMDRDDALSLSSEESEEIRWAVWII